MRKIKQMFKGITYPVWHPWQECDSCLQRWEGHRCLRLFVRTLYTTLVAAMTYFLMFATVVGVSTTREHSRLLKVDDVDEYIRYGGTLRMGTRDLDNPAAFAADASFRDDETTRVYVDAAIASNIQHSLRFFRAGKNAGYAFREKPFKCGVVTVSALSFREPNHYCNEERMYMAPDGGFTEQGERIQLNKVWRRPIVSREFLTSSWRRRGRGSKIPKFCARRFQN